MYSDLCLTGIKNYLYLTSLWCVWVLESHAKLYGLRVASAIATSYLSKHSVLAHKYRGDHLILGLSGTAYWYLVLMKRVQYEVLNTFC